VSQTPSPMPRCGINESAKINAAQTSTGSHAEARLPVTPGNASLDRKTSARGNPVRIRDGPVAVREDAPPPRCHWLKPGRRRTREPRVRRPAAACDPQLLAEGGMVFRL